MRPNRGFILLLLNGTACLVRKDWEWGKVTPYTLCFLLQIMYFFLNPRPTHCTCVTRYGKVSAPFAPKTSKLANISKNCQTNAWNRSVGWDDAGQVTCVSFRCNSRLFQTRLCRCLRYFGPNSVTVKWITSSLTPLGSGPASCTIAIPSGRSCWQRADEAHHHQCAPLCAYLEPRQNHKAVIYSTLLHHSKVCNCTWK